MDLINLDSILLKRNELVKPIDKFRHLGVEGQPHGLLVENCLITKDFLENRTDKITVAYLVSITEVISGCQLITIFRVATGKSVCLCVSFTY